MIAPSRDEIDRLEDRLRQRIAARMVLDAPPSGSTRTNEGEQAQRAMLQRESAAKSAVDEIAEELVRRAQVLLSAGAPQSGGSLKERVEAAAKAAAVRRYPQFDIADNAGWETVVTRARGGQPDALKAVGHNGSPDTEPVCQAIRSRLGAGRKGKELRDEFEGAPYGWPQDAVDGALYVLAHAGVIRTLDEAGQEITLRNAPRQKIGVCRFLPETHTVTLAHKKAIRQLGQTVEVPVTPDQEAEQLPLILERLREAAQAAGGEAPAPAIPATPDLDAVTQLAGNERLIEAASRVKALQDGYAAWKAAAQTIAARRPAYETTRRLVELGAHGQQAALDDVRSKRRLLEEPDPVPPLRQAAAAELRQRLNTSRGRLRRGLCRRQRRPGGGRQLAEARARRQAQHPRRYGLAGSAAPRGRHAGRHRGGAGKPLSVGLGGPDEVAATQGAGRARRSRGPVRAKSPPGEAARPRHDRFDRSRRPLAGRTAPGPANRPGGRPRAAAAVARSRYPALGSNGSAACGSSGGNDRAARAYASMPTSAA